MDLIGTVFPGLKARWLVKRAHLSQAQRLYQAAATSQYHPRKGDNRSANAVMEHARGNVTNWARNLEENYDLAVAVLDDLTDRVVGTGIIVEPQIKDRSGNLLEPLNQTIARAWSDWGRAPEVSGVVPWGELQRLLFRSLMRDGEALIKHLRGVPSYRYAGPVPYVIDSLESDYLPFDLTTGLSDRNVQITHGIERDVWGQITAYHLLRQHPGEYLVPLSVADLLFDTQRHPSDQITHLRFTRRLNQLRGISVFHASMHRLQDLTDYEESERLAAKIAASFSAVITKSADMPGILTSNVTSSGERNMEMSPAMIFDDLLPGEKVETIESNRPSNALGPYRDAMLKGVSGGTGARFSTIARTWDSSYTAMRQETVAHKPSTMRLQDYFVARAIRTIYEDWLAMAGLVDMFDFSGADRLTIQDADYRGPGEESIDPLDETKADVLRMQHRLKSRQQIHRERGIDTRRVDAELEADGMDQRPVDTEDTEDDAEETTRDRATT